MKRNFVSHGIQINVARANENNLGLIISSDYSRSNHKGRLYVDPKPLAETVERFWKSIKTKKLLKLNVCFEEIDWYDDMTDIYTTPYIHIERGLKKARIETTERGSIPKDWAFDLGAIFADTTTVTPILEVVKTALGSYFTPKMEKEFKKKMKPLLQKKATYANVQSEDEGNGDY